MGIDATGLYAINLATKYVTVRNKCLTLGRQGIHLTPDRSTYCEEMMKETWGFQTVDSLDASDYEGATIIHNMNKPLPENFKKYDFIFDGGSTEHIFNIPQTFENIINALEVGGVFCSVTCNNNYSGHGMYQFSPELYFSAFTEKYGMKIKEMYLAIVGSTGNFINVIEQKHSQHARTMCRFYNTNNEVYIIVIAQKVSEDRENLIEDPPNQFSYESYEWNK
jgi:hypothetical protein